MSHPHPIEALLRPPVELYSAAIAGCSSVVSLMAPSALMMTDDISLLSAAIFGVLAVRRGMDGARILRYQAGMRRLPKYSLTADHIPMSQHKLFLGKGFLWGQRHTQRLRDTIATRNERYILPTPAYRWARRKENDWENTPGLKSVARLLRQDGWWNPVKPLPDVGGNPCLHGVGQLDEHDAYLPLGERVGHTLVLGTTRVGKTRLAEVLITQDIRRGDVVIVFDPKGDADLLRRMYAEAKRAGRDQEFYMFHLGRPDISARYNALGNFSRITEVATRATQPLAGDGGSAAFKAFAWRFANIVSNALVSLGQRPTFDLLLRYVTNIESLFVDYAMHLFNKPELQTLLKEQFSGKPGGPMTWQQVLVQEEDKINEKNTPMNMRSRQKRSIALVNLIKAYRIFDPVLDGLRGAVEYDKTYFDKITASFLPFLEKLTSGRAGELISPNYFDVNDERPIFDWMQVIRKKAIVYVGLDALTDIEVSSAVGNSMFADLVSVSGYIYKYGTQDGLLSEAAPKPVISLHADEFNELIGNEFIPMVNKAGGSGVQVTAYTQTMSDIEARLGNKAKAGQVIGNFNTVIMLRVREEATALLLTSQLPRVEVNTLILATGVSDSSDTSKGVDFTSNNQDLVSSQMSPMLEPADLIRLPKGQAFALMQGGQLWKLRMPMPSTANDPIMPKTLADLTTDMQRDYRTGETWWLESGGRPGPSSSPIATSEMEPESESTASSAVTSSAIVDQLQIRNLGGL